MNITIMPNLDKKNSAACTREVSRKLHSLGVGVYLDECYKKEFSDCPVLFAPYDEVVERCDVIIAIGGDGTIIRHAKSAALHGKRLFGINEGRVGFLATMEPNQMEKIEDLVLGRYQVERRMMLEISHYSGQEKKTWYALNDVVISKGPFTRMIDFAVTCSGRLVGDYRGDGAVFATPTGSTAYALSAGGAIVDPALETIEMVAIAPHSLLSRPILFSPDSVLIVTAQQRSEQSHAYFSVDGEAEIPLFTGGRISIRRSPVYVELIDLGGKAFYEVLQKKIIGRG